MTLKALQILVVTAALALGCPARASAAGARVRWLPSPDGRVVGYYLYVRAAGTPYTAPLDVGLPPADPNGVLQFDVLDLPSGPHVFAVSGYTADTVTTSLSDEMRLGPPPTGCAVDLCTAVDSCTISVAPDGSPCGPAAAAGADCADVCLGGVCTTTTLASIETVHLKFQALATALRITARGRVLLGDIPGFDQSGFTFGVRDGSGGLLFDIAVPPGTLRRGSGVVDAFYLRTPATLTNAVLERFVARRLRDGWSIRLRLLLAAYTAAPADVELPATWSIRAASGCASDGALLCAGDARRVLCR